MWYKRRKKARYDKNRMLEYIFNSDPKFVKINWEIYGKHLRLLLLSSFHFFVNFFCRTKKKIIFKMIKSTNKVNHGSIDQNNSIRPIPKSSRKEYETFFLLCLHGREQSIRIIPELRSYPFSFAADQCATTYSWTTVPQT